ncbi:short chain dehydrogenase [Pedobacter aquatilis]|uniref:short chain dehydrogenase n=1 Tax=Pedobacter aquatilis TaxID=351343 RepID=UPI00292DA865|nr:short chain dehydrogenase [Pedobacter aquatilis]
MKIIVIGGTGTIGKRIVADLENDHEIIVVGATKGTYQVDITSTESIEKLFARIGNFDALISTAGNGHFGLLKFAKQDDFNIGLQHKLLGQINLVLIGQKFINPNGSFTLTSGILSDDPIKHGSNLSTVNAGINAFAKAAAIELENGVRINAVSPGVVADSPDLHPYFPGHTPAAMEIVVAAYRKSVLGFSNGNTIKAW